MKTRYLIIYILFFVTVGAVLCTVIAQGKKDVPEHTVGINRLLIQLSDNWESITSGGERLRNSSESFDYAVLDQDGRQIFSTREDMSVSVSEAVSHYDITRPIIRGEKTLGTLIVHDPIPEQQRSQAVTLALITAAVITLMLVISVCYFLYLKKCVVDPFKNMKTFAERIAAGDLDTPLEMDRGNIFGAFSESFDIMREELKASREREEAAVRSRKEMIASLSHDIKTPVASIKAMADVMELTVKDEEERSTLHAINAKADSIDKLVSNLFHATLEELDHLQVSCEEIASRTLAQILRESDHLGKLIPFEIPDCVIIGDRLRIEQVIGNIITNSYKYAETEIVTESFFEDGFLILELADKGGGVPEEELELVTEKFRRGTNAVGKDGSGIGLYISEHFMKCMGGSLSCRNNGEGFTVSLRLKLA